MTKKINVEIIINIDGKRHEMSLEDASILYKDLGEVFGAKRSVHEPVQRLWNERPPQELPSVGQLTSGPGGIMAGNLNKI